MRRVAACLAGAAAASFAAAQAGSSSSIGRPFPPQAHRPGQLIVQFVPAAGPIVEEDRVRALGGVRARRSAYGRHMLVTLDANRGVAEAVARFRSLPEVDYAEPNGLQSVAFVPNDTLFPSQWNLALLNATRAWDIQRGSTSVVVAVIDTGVAYEDFEDELGAYRKAPDWGSQAFLQGYDFVNDDTHANDDHFHGTHVASTIAEATDNVEGVAGLAFGCSLLPVKVLDSQGSGSFFDIAEGIGYATRFNQGSGRRVRVINLSSGGTEPSETMRRAVDGAVAAGIVVVAAAGNQGLGRVAFPAAFPNVIAVGAVDARKVRAPYSNFGPELDVVAPGGDMSRDDDGDGQPDGIRQQTFDPIAGSISGIYDQFDYMYLQGTSQATPHVAALAALLVSQGIGDPAAVKAAIEAAAEDIGPAGRDDEHGHGLIRPAEALGGLGLDR